MMTSAFYPIGEPGQAWTQAEKSLWLSRQQIQRSYQAEVVAPLQAGLPESGVLLQYGQLDYQRLGLPTYPLLAVRSRAWRADRPTVLVTGGVHGYETSGVQGALQFIAEQFDRYSAKVNLLVLPCISPWGYETINRWNPDAIDPNRSFVSYSLSQEAAAVMALVHDLAHDALLHVDLHETTDSDNSEFCPAKAARDGLEYIEHDVPDGFYLVGDTEKPAPEFQRAIIAAVQQVTHIALPDTQGCIIGEPLQQFGVINYAKKALGLCGGMTEAQFVTTTEVYPDSPSASPAQCNQAQLVTICAAIDYVLAK